MRIVNRLFSRLLWLQRILFWSMTIYFDNCQTRIWKLFICETFSILSKIFSEPVDQTSNSNNMTVCNFFSKVTRTLNHVISHFVYGWAFFLILYVQYYTINIIILKYYIFMSFHTCVLLKIFRHLNFASNFHKGELKLPKKLRPNFI